MASGQNPPRKCLEPLKAFSGGVWTHKVFGRLGEYKKISMEKVFPFQYRSFGVFLKEPGNSGYACRAPGISFMCLGILCIPQDASRKCRFSLGYSPPVVRPAMPSTGRILGQRALSILSGQISSRPNSGGHPPKSH